MMTDRGTVVAAARAAAQREEFRYWSSHRSSATRRTLAAGCQLARTEPSRTTATCASQPPSGLVRQARINPGCRVPLLESTHTWRRRGIVGSSIDGCVVANRDQTFRADPGDRQSRVERGTDHQRDPLGGSDVVHR